MVCPFFSSPPSSSSSLLFSFVHLLSTPGPVMGMQGVVQVMSRERRDRRERGEKEERKRRERGGREEGGGREERGGSIIVDRKQVPKSKCFFFFVKEKRRE